MDKVQESKYNMYKAVSSFLNNTNPILISKMPQMDEAVLNLQNNITEIQQILEKQIQNYSGIKVSKDVTKTEIVNAIFVLAGQVRSFAVNTNNIVLLDEVYYTITKLRAMTDANLIINASIIIEKAHQNLTNLTEYGVTPTSLSEIVALLDQFSLKLAQPRNAIASKTEKTQLIKHAFAKTDLLLNQKMDALVIILKFSDPQFYNIYHNNRQITKPAYTTLAISVTVTDIDNQPLQKVKATIEGYTKIYKTTANGRFHVKSLPEGMHMITFRLPNYKTQTLNVPVIKGTRNNLKVTLEILE